MPNYTKEEIAAFGRKDLLNSRMSAVKATSVNFESKSVSFKEFKEFADDVFSWVQQDQLSASPIPKVADEVKVKGGVLPTPTADQKLVLDAIDVALINNDFFISLDELSKQVLRFSTKVAGVDKATYPTNLASVGKIVEWIQNN